MNALTSGDTLDIGWLAGLLGGSHWPALLPPAEEARRQRALRAIRLEGLLPLLERATAEGRRGVTIGAYQAWLAANPGHPQALAAWFNLGVELAQAGEPAQAAICYRNALALKADFHAAAVNLGLALEAAGQAQAALDAWEQALQPEAMRRELLNQRGRLLEQTGRFAEAEQALRASLMSQAGQPDVLQHWTHLRQKLCQWPIHAHDIPELSPEQAQRHAGPLGALALYDDIDVQRDIVAAWLARKVPAAPRQLAPPRGYRHDRIRLGYLSSDFCRHAMSFLIAELLERHDRHRFEVFGYCSSPEDGSPVRARVIAALDHHVRIADMPDAVAAQRIRDDEIDILVDLNGLTRGARLGVLRWKPAPVQATWLGYIGSVPLPELDYLLCDAITIPADRAARYAPTPLPIDGVYQANDSTMPALPELTRAEEGLPSDGFVYCCFANFYKITQPMFEDWCRILHAVPGSVLWLAEDGHGASAHLRRAAAAAGLGADRLVFGPRVEPPRYLARLRLADLFLDTTPYNSGTVASDALRMGLPLLTRSGEAFAGRMATSLLSAIGLADGITTTREAYVQRAIAFGTDPSRHAAARAVLAGDAWARSLGDCAGFARRLEAALTRVRLSP
ncbi:O-linked N-acetylglucosamine transferase, SPINDLY family protein [Falsiroseomonas selenitidurans]|uniref:protein O-GlcNAc transferase n=1 Tax=Falsiroseomonas selenitidurans TaxID=2716335 RepID=A0ABX1DY06_9PROT|nr:acetylglucosamine transferase [Falsiroseomonas selenitidurans]NKC29754.1 acetylglucosamine transferase [Falsiroseomonas selenitidurans]